MSLAGSHQGAHPLRYQQWVGRTGRGALMTLVGYMRKREKKTTWGKKWVRIGWEGGVGVVASFGFTLIPQGETVTGCGMLAAQCVTQNYYVHNVITSHSSLKYFQGKLWYKVCKYDMRLEWWDQLLNHLQIGNELMKDNERWHKNHSCAKCTQSYFECSSFGCLCRTACVCHVQHFHIDQSQQSDSCSFCPIAEVLLNIGTLPVFWQETAPSQVWCRQHLCVGSCTLTWTHITEKRPI